MSTTESITSGAVKGIAPYAIGGGLLLVAWLFRDKIAAWLAGNVPGVKQAGELAETVIDTGGAIYEGGRNLGGLLPETPPDVPAAVSGAAGSLFDWVRNLGGLLPETLGGGSSQVTDTSGLLIASPDQIPPEADILAWARNTGAYHSGIEPMESVMGLQGIGLSTEIIQEISPTLNLVEKQYNAPGVHTSEVVYQDVWGGIIGSNLAAGSAPGDVAACLAAGGGWNWNDRRCYL